MYIILKALHVCSVLLWIGGMLVSAVMLAATRVSTDRGKPAPLALLARVRRWDHTVTSPAIVLTWCFGLALAVLGGWFHAGWFMAKLALVVILSGVHGILSGQLRRAASGPVGYTPRSHVNVMPYMVTAGACLVVLLVIVKPF
ncbi:UNVERIFIED_ORG: putative membrane protein [Burkholderia sp. CF145]